MTYVSEKVVRVLRKRGKTEEEIDAILQPNQYHFNFGKYYGDTIEEVWRQAPSYISNFIIRGHLDGDSDLLLDRPELMDALKSLSDDILDRCFGPRQELEQTHPFDEREPIRRPEIMTDRGPLFVNSQYLDNRYWEAKDVNSILQPHQNAADANYAEFAAMPSYPPVYVSYTATVLPVLMGNLALDEETGEGPDEIHAKIRFPPIRMASRFLERAIHQLHGHGLRHQIFPRSRVQNVSNWRSFRQG